MVGGEANWGIHEFKDMLDEDVRDVLMPEVINLGPAIVTQHPHVGGGLRAGRCSPHGAGATAGPLCDSPRLRHQTPRLWSLSTNHQSQIFASCRWLRDAPVLEKDGYMKVPRGPALGVTLQPNERS